MRPGEGEDTRTKPLLQGHMAMKHTPPTRCQHAACHPGSLGKPERLSNYGDCRRKPRREVQRDSTQRHAQRKPETIALMGVIRHCKSGEV